MAQDGNCIFELNEGVERTHVSYGNRFGIELSADLYLPQNRAEGDVLPAVLVGAPYGGVKEQGPGVYANELARRGFAALAFDASYNGYSGGNPRHISSPETFVEDFHAGVDYLGTRPFVDRERIGVAGICGSGGFALSAMQVDPRIKAAVTASMYDMSRATQEAFGTMTDEVRAAQLADIAEQRYIDFAAPYPTLTPRGRLEADYEADPVFSEFCEFYARERGWHHNAIAQFSITSSQAFMNFKLLDHLDWIAPRRILCVVGEHAHSRFFSEDVCDRAGESAELFVVPGANHVDLYDKTDVIPFDAVEAFLRENLR